MSFGCSNHEKGATVEEKKRFRLLVNGDGLQFEVTAAKERSGSDEFAGRQILGGEVAFVDGIELVEEREVSASDLDVDEVVHGHASLCESALEAVEHQFNFFVNLGGRLSGFRIETDSAGQIESVAGEDAVAERRLNGFLGRVERFAGGLGRGLRKRTTYADDASNQ